MCTERIGFSLKIFFSKIKYQRLWAFGLISLFYTDILKNAKKIILSNAKHFITLYMYCPLEFLDNNEAKLTTKYWQLNC